MGLDMYLTAKISASDYAHDKPEERELVAHLYKSLGIDETLVRSPGTVLIDIPIGYWRKANAIHAWFVQHVQEGEDDCKEYYVNEEDLKELEQVCKEVLLIPAIGPTKLPSSQGFFFGGTAYDEYYMQNIHDTLEILKRVKQLQQTKPCDIYYQSSW